MKVMPLVLVSRLVGGLGLLAGGLIGAEKEATPVPEAVEPGVVVLKPVEVTGQRTKPEVRLPRVSAPRAVNPGVETRDPFLTGAERSRRLKKKHLTALDSGLLNRVHQPGSIHSAERRAAEAEKQEQFAEGMNSLAESIQLGAATGEDPKETKKLQAMYRDLLMSKPR